MFWKHLFVPNFVFNIPSVYITTYSNNAWVLLFIARRPFAPYFDRNSTNLRWQTGTSDNWISAGCLCNARSWSSSQIQFTALWSELVTSPCYLAQYAAAWPVTSLFSLLGSFQEYDGRHKYQAEALALVCSRLCRAWEYALCKHWESRYRAFQSSWCKKYKINYTISLIV